MEDTPWMTTIPGISNDIVQGYIFPLLPWHTRPLLLALKSDWNNQLQAIGLEGQNILNPWGQRIAKLTRLTQPLKCRLAVEYYRERYSEAGTEVTLIIKIFDGQWRNLPALSQYIISDQRAKRFYGHILGVVGGTLYFRAEDCIVALDVGSGLWQWKSVFGKVHQKSYICTSGRAPGGLFIFSSRNAHSHITEISTLEPRLSRLETILEDNRLKYDSINYSCKPSFAHVGYGLYFFGADDYTRSVWFYDLNQRSHTADGRKVHTVDTWCLQFQRPSVNRHRRTVYVETTLLLVAKCGKDQLEIVRYSCSTATWIIVGSIKLPRLKTDIWSWCVEYDRQAEKQLYIYVCDEAFRVHKWRVDEKEVEGRTRGKVWNDKLLPRKRVECQLVDEQRFEVPTDSDEVGRYQMLRGLRCNGFHRSDLPNFEDIPRDNEPIFRPEDDVPH